MSIYLESKLQTSCMTWLKYQHPDIERLCFAVPNGAKRNRASGGLLKAQGMKAGVADLILLIPKGPFSSLCIEMKAGDKGKQSDLQKSWQELAEKHGNKYVVCRSFDEFRRVINDYLFWKP